MTIEYWAFFLTSLWDFEYIRLDGGNYEKKIILFSFDSDSFKFSYFSNYKNKK